MKTMKKLMIIGMVMALAAGAFTGCQTLKQAFCSPTAQQVADAADYVANADAILAFMSNLAPNTEVTAAIAAIKVAKGVFDQIKAGICVDEDQEAAAAAAITANQAVAMKYGYKP